MTWEAKPKGPPRVIYLGGPFFHHPSIPSLLVLLLFYPSFFPLPLLFLFVFFSFFFNGKAILFLFFNLLAHPLFLLQTKMKTYECTCWIWTFVKKNSFWPSTCSCVHVCFWQPESCFLCPVQICKQRSDNGHVWRTYNSVAHLMTQQQKYSARRSWQRNCSVYPVGGRRWIKFYNFSLVHFRCFFLMDDRDCPFKLISSVTVCFVFIVIQRNFA